LVSFEIGREKVNPKQTNKRIEQIIKTVESSISAT